MPTPQAPVLHTAHFVLRPFTNADVDAHAQICADAEVMRHVGDGRPLTSEQAWAQLAFHIGHWTLRGYGCWAIEARTDGSFVGRVGFVHPPDLDAPELAVLLERRCHGRGYGVEVMSAAARWGLQTAGMTRIASWVRPDHVASAKTMAKLGAHQTGRAQRHGRDFDLWTIDQSDPGRRDDSASGSPR